MKEYQSEEIRNFALLGHASSGKTMLSEAILVNAGVIGRLGSIAGGSTFSDYTDEEETPNLHSNVFDELRLEWEKAQLY